MRRKINLKDREEQQQSSPARLSGFGVFGRYYRDQFCFIMSSDEIVWQVINQQFCSYKLKYAQPFAGRDQPHMEANENQLQ